jgi:hypothetical protein
VETTEEDRAIISLANAINSKLMEYIDEKEYDDTDKDDEENIDIEPQETDYLGTIGQLFDTPLEILNPIHIMISSDYDMRLRIKDTNGEMFQSPDKSVIYGLWYSGSHPKMIFNSDFIGTKNLLSVISHELRHALDDVKSNQKSHSSKKYNIPKKHEHRKGRFGYIAQPSEINARFVQVLHDIVPIIKRTARSNPNEKIFPILEKELFKLLDYHEIAKLFPEKEKSRDYKRLIKRGMDFITKETNFVLNQLRNIHPVK